jgi:hypothetical protein
VTANEDRQDGARLLVRPRRQERLDQASFEAGVGLDRRGWGVGIDPGSTQASRYHPRLTRLNFEVFPWECSDRHPLTELLGTGILSRRSTAVRTSATCIGSEERDKVWITAVSTEPCLRGSSTGLGVAEASARSRFLRSPRRRSLSATDGLQSARISSTRTHPCKRGTSFFL